ncbi:MAG: adenylate/guanylate cyclase domain-containing protein [Chloroflexi bacterium]|nr:adenylate/guanylate cyclase domain-containing protein [Chloroflexota bacterium]
MHNIKQKMVNTLARIGADPNDSSEMRTWKIILVGGYAIGIMAAIVLAITYAIYNEFQAVTISLTVVAVSLLSILMFHFTRNYKVFRVIVLLVFLLLPFSVPLTLGGIYSSSFSVLWTMLCPVLALLTSRGKFISWFLAFLGVLLISVVLQPYLQPGNNIPALTLDIIFLMNTFGTTTILFLTLTYFVNQKDTAYRLLAIEEKKSESLLLNILPEEIANILKTEKRPIADHYEAASIMFADMVGFTPLSIAMSPDEMVNLLNEIYSHFDSLADKYGLEKIRTIGDNYMVASGVPSPRVDHAQAIAQMALDILEFGETVSPQQNNPILFRIGINSGPLVAGVIGTRKFHYDVWGDTVNTASRMESHSAAGKIQITSDTYALLKDDFECESRGIIDVKGKGEMETWFLIKKKIK